MLQNTDISNELHIGQVEEVEFRWLLIDFFHAALYNDCRFSKLDPREFIGGFGRLAIACLHGDADKRRDLGRAKRTPNPYLAAFGIDRAVTSNRGAGAQPNSSSLLPSLRSPVLDLAIALVVGLARKPGDRPAGDRLALAPQRLVRNVEISVTWLLARRASKGFPRGPRSDHADGP